MNIRLVKIRTAFAAAYIVGVSCVVGVVSGKALAEHYQSPIRAFVSHCQQGGGTLGIEAAANGRTLVITPVCRFAPDPIATPLPPQPPAGQAATGLQI